MPLEQAAIAGGEIIVRHITADGSLSTVMVGKVIPGAQDGRLAIESHNGEISLIDTQNPKAVYSLPGSSAGRLWLSSNGRKGRVRVSYLTDSMDLTPEIHLTLTRVRDSHYTADVVLVLWINNATDLCIQGATVDLVAGRFPRRRIYRNRSSMLRMESPPSRVHEIMPGALERIRYSGVNVRCGRHAMNLLEASMSLDWVLVVDMEAANGPAADVFFRIHSSNADLPASEVIATSEGLRVGQGRMSQFLVASTGEEWIAMGRDDMVRVSNDTSSDRKSKRTEHSVTVTNMRKRPVQLLVYRYLRVGDSWSGGEGIARERNVSKEHPSYPGRSRGNTAVIWDVTLPAGEKLVMKLLVTNEA